jgi:2-polyprenyl-3-methyl-5-hydroxy-6-metoxy-1,4-benzoquinol methylase
LRRLVPLRLRRPIGIAAYRLKMATPRTVRRRSAHFLAHSRTLWARSLLYNERYYQKSDAWKTALYPALATALVELTHPQSAVDVGCGSGLMLEVLARLGVEIRGSKAASRQSDDHQ